MIERGRPASGEGSGEQGASASWLPTAEHIAISATVQGSQVIGFVSPEASSGVSGLSRLVARTFAQSGIPTLLFDLSASTYLGAPDGKEVAPNQPWRRLRPTEDGLATLVAMPTPTTRHLFGNIGWLRQNLAEDFATYPKIVLDLPPLCSDQARPINPLGPAALCDWVVLVCARGRITKPRIDEALSLLQMAGANLKGTVLNEGDYTSTGEDIARAVHRIRWLMLGTARRIEAASRKSQLLK